MTVMRSVVITSPPSEEELRAGRYAAELSGVKPYLDAEISSMQKSIVNSVTTAINSGTLTPDLALSKWHEYMAYTKLANRLTSKQNSFKQAK